MSGGLTDPVAPARAVVIMICMRIFSGYGALVAALIGVALTAPAWPQGAQPSPEQLLAASIHADDLGKVNPGGWWDDAPEFNSRLDPEAGDALVTAVTAHVFGRPDAAPAEIATSLRLYARASDASDTFDATATGDRRDYSETIDGPKLGDRSRYLHQPADSGHEGGIALRFQFGRYLVRIDVGGDASTLPPDKLALLGQIVADRLKELDAGKLAAPALPNLAQALPAADEAFRPVLGTASLSSLSWAWVWSSQASELIVSGRLRALLKDSVRDAPVLRRYRIAGDPADIAEVTIMPFRTPDAAGRYLAEIKREDARRSAVTAGEGDIMVSPPIADVAPAYRADVRVGRYVAEVTCFAPFAPTASACGRAVKEMAERAKKTLPEK